MAQISRSNFKYFFLAVWVSGLVLFSVLGWWNLTTFKKDAENRLINDAGRAASQLAGLLSLPGWNLDEISARQIVMGAMEDERIYAIKVDSRLGMLEGQRRNYLWEPIPWDDEITENCVLGTTPLRIDGQAVGKVNVWISQRLAEEENSVLSRREVWRFLLVALAWTLVLFFALRHWGRPFVPSPADSDDSPALTPADSCTIGEKAASETEGVQEEHACINSICGRKYQCGNPDAWQVTAGMFRQTFARGPALISRLYSEGETAGLCHLGRILEQAAPCIGAMKLRNAARAMQEALNDPDCGAQAIPVEECAIALEEVLNALCGNGQWRSRPGAPRS